jgi:hypothetical protein
MASKPFFGV